MLSNSLTSQTPAKKTLPILEAHQEGHGIIMEGADGAFDPEVIFVRQADKVLFFKGNDTVVESIDPATEGLTVVESIDDLELVERAGAGGQTVKSVKDGTWVVEGPFQQADKKNSNGRIYSRKLFERLIGDDKSSVQQLVRERGMHGHVEHPTDGRSDLAKSAMTVTELKLRDDGVVWGRAELLNTPGGLILQEHTMRGNKWGVSSRGRGTVHPDGRIDEANFTFDTWDAVSKPSVTIALPKAVKEGDAPAAPKVRPLVEAIREGRFDDSDYEVMVEAVAKQFNIDTDELRRRAAVASVKETDETEALAASVRSLCETDLTDLDTAKQMKLTADLLQHFGRVTGAMKDRTIKTDRAVTLLDSIDAMLKSVCEAEVDVDAALTEAMREAADTEDADRRTKAVSQVVGSVQRQLEAVSGEATQLRREAQDARDRLAESERRRQTAEAALATALSASRKHAVRADRLQGELDMALELVSCESVEDYDDVEDAPVSQESDEVTGDAVVEGASPAAAPIHRRHTLPHGPVESADDAAGGGRQVRSASTMSPGVRVASAAISAAKPREPKD